MTVVADASAVGSFLLPDEDGLFAVFAREICSRNMIIVPPHWTSEVASILWKAHRRQRIDRRQLDQYARAATTFARSVMIGSQTPIDKLTAFATEHALTTYDTAYLILAQTENCALLTADKAMAVVARARGIDVLAP